METNEQRKVGTPTSLLPEAATSVSFMNGLIPLVLTDFRLSSITLL